MKLQKRYLLMEYKIKNIYIAVCCILYVFLYHSDLPTELFKWKFLFQRVFYAFLWNSFYIFCLKFFLLLFQFIFYWTWMKICVCSNAMTKIVLYEYAILSMMTTAIYIYSYMRFLSKLFLAVFLTSVVLGYVGDSLTLGINLIHPK